MKKLSLTIALFVLCACTIHGQLLYRISGNSLKSPSYIIGTHHLAPNSFVDSIPGLRKAMADVAQVYGEIDMQDMLTPENVQKVRESMNMKDGKTLQTLFTEEELGRINKLMKELFGADLTHPIIGAEFGKMSPQALNTQLTVLMYLKSNPDFTSSGQIDSYIQEEARKAKKPVGSLETLDQQIQVLYGSIPIERQKVLLMCLVDNKDYIESMTEELTKAYLAQDLAAIEALNDEKTNTDCDSSDEENEILIYGRNANWLKQIPGIISSKPTLFAVGAAHLVGNRGLLKQLEKAGYTVEGVTK